MKECRSKRRASSSPKRQTKRTRNPENEINSSDEEKKRCKDRVRKKISEDRHEDAKSRKHKPADESKNSKKKKSDKRKSRDSSKKEKIDSASATDSEHSHSEQEEIESNPTTGSRYWGIDKEKQATEDGELSSHSNDAEYEVGQRYYNPVSSDTNKEKDEAKLDFVVGKRYYEDEPDKATDQKNDEGNKTEQNLSASIKAPTRRAKLDDPLLSRTGGAYIPPAKLRLMQASITDKSSVSYQRIAWEALKKSIHGHINKVNTSNIGIIARLLMKENIVRGRGLLSRSLLQAQAASPTFTNVYASLVSIINSKFPNIGELIMKRVILQFKRGFKRNDKALCISSCQFIAHLVNQQVAHEILALEMLTLLLESPTDDSVEVAVAFLKEVGQKLLELSPKGTNAIFDMLRNILHQGNLEKRVQYMIEVVFQVRKDGFRSFESIAENLDLVEEEDRFTHILTLDEAVDPEDMLNVFKHDLEYELNENKYKALKEEIIGETSSEDESGDEGSEDDSDEGGSDDDDDEEGDAKESKSLTIHDATETNLVALRRTIYLTIQSSLDFEECCHKLLKMDIKPGQEPELCHMLLDCCAELRTYEKFFGLLAQRFCQINRVYIAPLEEMFAGSYATVHRLDTNKLRNVARFFGHLLFTDAISWQVLETVKLNEEDTTSSSRIFIKILFQELAEYMGLAVLNQRLKDPTLQSAMEGLFPRDNPKNTRFAINFFTSIGLGGLTDDLREHLKTQPKTSAVAQLVEKLDLSSDSSSSSSSSSDSSDSDSSDDDSSDSDNEKKKSKPAQKDQEKRRKNDVANNKNEKNDKDNKRKTLSSEDWKKAEGPRNERQNKKDKNEDYRYKERETQRKTRDRSREKLRNETRDNNYRSHRDDVSHKPEKHDKQFHKNKTPHNKEKYDRESEEKERRHEEKNERKYLAKRQEIYSKRDSQSRDKENRQKESKQVDRFYEKERERKYEIKGRDKYRKYNTEARTDKKSKDYNEHESSKHREHYRKHRRGQDV